MPLYNCALAAIKYNLKTLESGAKPKAIAIGKLSDSQLAALNAKRKTEDMPDVVSEILFMGKHVYESRVLRDGYSIEDVLDQIASALNEAAQVLPFQGKNMMENPNERCDRYGNKVKDRALFEAMARYPKLELFSVIPFGDKIRPAKAKEATPKK